MCLLVMRKQAPGQGEGPGPGHTVRRLGRGPVERGAGRPVLWCGGSSVVGWEGRVGSSQRPALSGLPGAGSDSEAKSGGPEVALGSGGPAVRRGSRVLPASASAGCGAVGPFSGWERGSSYVCALCREELRLHGEPSLDASGCQGSPVPACCPLWGCSRCGRSLGGLSVGLSCLWSVPQLWRETPRVGWGYVGIYCVVAGGRRVEPPTGSRP